MIRTYEIDDSSDLYFKKPEIVECCRTNNARAYFRVNSRSKRRLAAEMSKSILDQIIAGDFHLRKTYEKCLGNFPVEDHKLWILDIDDDLGYSDDGCLNLLNEIFRKLNPKRADDLNHFWVPTVNGRHLVIEAFPLKFFHDLHPEVSVHQDNGTLLYYENN